MGHHPVRVEPGAWSRENGYHTGSYTSEGHCDDCDGHNSIWRILTAEQIRQKFAHLSKRDTPTRAANRAAAEHIEEIWAEQEQKNAELRTRVPTNVSPLRIADRYVRGRRWTS